MVNEKRRHPRFSSLNTVAYFCLDEGAEVISQGMGRTLNLSRSGILLHTFRPIDACHQIRIHVGLKEDLLEMLGRVVHCRKDSEEGFCYGIEFVELEAQGTALLETFVKAFNAASDI